MKFLLPMPGLTRYPPAAFPVGREHWQASMTAADFQRVATATEELGFDAIVVPEHLAVPTDLEPNLGGYYPHALTAMAFIAGATTRIKVNSMVLVLPYHHPVELAKAIATLDVMSGGRAMVTFGVGMAPIEFAAMGIPFEARGRVTDEYVQALKVLWDRPLPEFAGEFVQFCDVVCEPKPLQRPHPPLWFGGRSLQSLRRAARHGDGWAPSGGQLGKGPWLEEPEQLPGMLEEVHEVRANAAGDQPFDVFLSVVQHRIGPGHTHQPPNGVPESAEQIVDRVGRLGEFGVTWTSVSRPGDDERSLEAYLENLQWVAEEVIARCPPVDSSTQLN